jgi:hypothetical protein
MGSLRAEAVQIVQLGTSTHRAFIRPSKMNWIILENYGSRPDERLRELDPIWPRTFLEEPGRARNLSTILILIRSRASVLSYHRVFARLGLRQP